MSKNIALITGVTGQDGSYLSEFLLEKGYEVHGIIRRSSVDYRERIAHLEGNPGFHLHYADLGDSMSIVKVVDTVEPIPENAQRYEERYQQFRKIYPAVKALFPM